MKVEFVHNGIVVRAKAQSVTAYEIVGLRLEMYDEDTGVEMDDMDADLLSEIEDKAYDELYDKQYELGEDQ